MGKSSKDKRDAYYRLAKEQSWRARSAFKLLQLDEVFDLFGPDVTRVVDLCAAPGSWSQVLSRVLIKGECLGRRAWEAKIRRERKEIYTDLTELPEHKEATEEIEDDLEGLKPRKDVRIVAIDLQPIAHLEGITTLVGDITHPSTIPRILHALDPDDETEAAACSTASSPVDLVISDGAPDVTGLHDLDIFVQAQLLFSALNLALRLLKPGGKFVAKIFRGKDVDFIYAQLRCFFARVTCAKPRSSRASSLEAFVVCEGFSLPAGFKVEDMLPLGIGMPFSKAADECTALTGSDAAANRHVREDGVTVMELPGDDNGNSSTETAISRWIAPFVACGDLSAFDADATYQLPKDHVSLDPVRPPVNPPYKKALEERRRKGGLYGKTKT